MPGTVTVTAKVGPAVQATALPLPNSDLVTFDSARRMLFVTQSAPNRINEFDLSAVTTVTITVSGLNYNVTLT